MKIKYPKLAQKLRRLAWQDQAVLWSRGSFEKVRNKNTEILKRIVNKYGWPTISKVGELASGDAWLLVQHSDHDVEFQSQVLKLMKSVRKGEVLTRNIAYLEDRVRKNLGKPQLYGTQVLGNRNRFTLYKILDRKNLDKMRSMMGLGPMTEYIKLVKQVGKLRRRGRPRHSDQCPCDSGKIFKNCHGVK